MTSGKEMRTNKRTQSNTKNERTLLLVTLLAVFLLHRHHHDIHLFAKLGVLILRTRATRAFY